MHERGGGHPNGIVIQITHKTKTVKTKTGIEHDVPVIERFTLTDDLDGVEERVVDSNRKNESGLLRTRVVFWQEPRCRERPGSCTRSRSTSTASACRS